MENNKTFTITFTKLNGESTTRRGKWTERCQEFVAKAGHRCLTFLDLDATKEKGTGLGLSIVDKIISDHNGSVKFSSNNNGAKVEITLPKN